MKAIYKIILILLFISFPSIASACHEGDFESSGKGHRLEIVLNREPELLDKCLLPAQSAYSKVVFLA